MNTRQPARRSANVSPADVTARTTTEVDPVHFRRVLGHYPTGVCVITAEHPEAGPVGTTVGSFTSVSLDPPLVAFFPMKGSRTYQRIAETGRFCVNVLSKDQEDLCRRFASRDPDKFQGVSFSPSPLGSPILDDVVAWIDCRLSHVQDAGDHLAVYGKVETLTTGDHHAPLIFFQGGYGRFSSLSLTAPAEDDIAAQVRLADAARPHLERISKEFLVEAHAGTVSGDHVVQLAWAGAEGINLHASKVGLRLPLVPPMGLLFVAWEDDKVREKWLSGCSRRLGGPTEEVYLREIARARAQGWISVPDHERLNRVEDTVVRMAAEGQTADIQRELTSHLDAFAEEYAVLVRESGGDTCPSGLSVPVFDSCSRVALVLTVHGLMRLSTAEVDRCRAQLLDLADELTRRNQGVVPGTARVRVSAE